MLLSFVFGSRAHAWALSLHPWEGPLWVHLCSLCQFAAVAVTVTHLLAGRGHSCGFKALLTLCMVVPLKSCHSREAQLPPCVFCTLHLPGYGWGWTPLHVFIGHLEVCFGEAPFKFTASSFLLPFPSRLVRFLCIFWILAFCPVFVLQIFSPSFSLWVLDFNETCSVHVKVPLWLLVSVYSLFKKALLAPRHWCIF